MRLRFYFHVLSLLVVLAFPAAAGAVQLVNPDGSVAQPYQTWADAAKVPTPNHQVTVIRDASKFCGQPVAGCAWRDGTAIAIGCDIGAGCQRVFMHELGHVFDFEMPEWKRQVFRKIVGLQMSWYAARPHFQASYSEYFANSYANLAISSDRSRIQRRMDRLIRQPN